MRKIKFIMMFGALVLFVILYLASHRGQHVAHVTRDAQRGYEIRLDTSELSFGGPCNFPTMPHRIQGADWIYTRTTNGVVRADQLSLSHGKDPFYRWTQEALRGTITFTGGQMKVEFQVPNFDQQGTLVRYERYQHNGDSRLASQ
jgi:hypothetical protein